MKRVVLFTQKYKPLLAEFHAAIAKKRKRGVYVREVMYLLEQAAMHENAVYRYSPKLRVLARTLRNTSRYTRDLAALRQYLHYNDFMQIEGYIRFRMKDYAEALDMLSYRLIKKLRARACED